jgi:mRNA-degrading endonuclease toxin of MazEF toxin-antitoxin module
LEGVFPSKLTPALKQQYPGKTSRKNENPRRRSRDPTRVPIELKGKEGWIVLDQIRTVDKQRLVAKLGQLRPSLIKKVKAVIQEMLVD